MPGSRSTVELRDTRARKQKSSLSKKGILKLHRCTKQGKRTKFPRVAERTEMQTDPAAAWTETFRMPRQTPPCPSGQRPLFWTLNTFLGLHGFQTP